MLGQQFYNETMRKVVVAFGTMFNNINLVRMNSAGEVTQTMKVPLAYVFPKNKWLQDLEKTPTRQRRLRLLYLVWVLRLTIFRMTLLVN